MSQRRAGADVGTRGARAGTVPAPTEGPRAREGRRWGDIYIYIYIYIYICIYIYIYIYTYV